MDGWQREAEELTDVITPGPVARLAATLDLPPPGPVLPPLWHWLFFLPAASRSRLGPDGHPERGGFLPPLPHRRRLFAGGRVHFTAPLRVGDEIARYGEVAGVAEKQGRRGGFVLVTVRYEITGARGTAVVEEQDLAFTDAAPVSPAEAAVPVPEVEWTASFPTDPVLLFRFSALTFNGHRIHYDAVHAATEGYRGPVVHGPLVALLLAGMAAERGGRPLRAFRYRARAPFFAGETLELRGSPGGGGADLAAYTPAGVVGMEARAEFTR